MQSADHHLIWEPWLARAHERPDEAAVVHWSLTAPATVWSAKSLVAAAFEVAARLREAGVKPQEVCAIILRHHLQFYPIYLGIVFAGAVPAVLPYPNPRLHPDKFRHGLEGMLTGSGFDWILTEDDLIPLLGKVKEEAGRLFRGILYPLQWTREPSAFEASPLPSELPYQASSQDACLLQHSSGTTGLQKPIMLSHQSVVNHLHRYAEAIAVTAEDKVASWLPLYHDMGLIAGFHLPLAAGIPLIQVNPFEWVQSPLCLLKVMAEYHASLAWLPNFSYNLMAARVDAEAIKGTRLDCVRLLVNCSERVRADSHRRFSEAFAPYGLRPEALGASYAMAEATFAVTQTPPSQPARERYADAAALARGRFVECASTDANAAALSSSGKLLQGCDIRIVGPSGSDIADGEVGSILIRSESLFSGYRNYPEKTRGALRDGWYISGDMGFRIDGDYYVIGRSKDVIIVAGKNIYPEDIETAVSDLAGVIPGRVVAVGVENQQAGTEDIWVIAESEISDDATLKALKRTILSAGIRADVTIARVILVPPRWLIKSSSGKLSRQANRDRAREIPPEMARA